MDLDPEQELEAEIALMRQIAQGDQRAFGMLYDRFSGILFSTAYRVLNHQQAAEDLVQDAFVQIWEKAPLYDASRGKPLTWAVTLTRNRAIDRLRSTQRRRQLQDDLERESETFEHFDDRSSLDAVTSAETSQLVRAALKKLPAAMRKVIELAFLGSLKQSEIADLLDIPLGTVKARMRRGMMKLQATLATKV